MLLQIRNLTRGALATIILGLVGLAMVAFLIPGGGLQFNLSRNLAEVGGRAITPPQLTRELDLTLRGQRAEGVNITQQEAIEAGLHLRLLESMIGRAALHAYAEKLGVSASDAQVAARIREIPAVQNPVSGSFDQSQYDAFLGQLRYTRSEFEQDIRNDLTTQMLMNALISGVRPPSSFGAMAFAYEAETRVVSIAEAPAAAIGAVAPPTEEQLQSFWEESQEQLRLPEFRALTLVYARPQDFVTRVDVPEERLREEFEARRAALTRPERRSYVRISAQTEAQATEAAARLARGESADAVAAALGLQATRGENQARAEVPDARVAEAVFGMQPRSAPRVVSAQLTPWAVVRVDSVTPASEPSYAEQRDDLRRAIAEEEAADLLNTAIGAFEEARAAGVALADAARQTGLAIVTVPAVEPGGRGQDGAPVEALVGQEDLLETAFRTPEGEASDFIPVGEADVIISVDRIIPSTVRPLDEVRDELAQAWVARERVRRLRDLGREVVTAVSEGQSFAAAARARRMDVVVSSRPIDRRGASQIPARGLAGQIFAARQGAVVTDMRADGGAVLVAIVEEINRVDPAAAPQVVEANRLQMRESLAASFGEALQSEVVEHARPRRNERLIAQVYRGTNNAENAP
jgi:peptidyl-prolyl cis-trans isomerase D